jgi:heat shock protein HslJ
MMCPDQATESQFTALLERVTHYEVDGSLLLLLSNGEMQAVLSAVTE